MNNFLLPRIFTLRVTHFFTTPNSESRFIAIARKVWVSISKKAVKKMTAYHWPGNVRELRNALERAVVLGNGKEVLPDDLPILNSQPKYTGLEIGLSLREALDTFKMEFIKINLKHSNGSRSKAAKVMGIQRTYLSSLISKYDLQDM